MSRYIARTAPIQNPRTVFETAWNTPDELLYRSPVQGIMVAIDAFPRLRNQVVVAPKFGNPTVELDRVWNRPEIERRKLHAAADFMSRLIEETCEPDEYAIQHLEGNGVKNHAHIVVASVRPKEGQALYDGPKLGESAVSATLANLAFSFREAAALEAELDSLNFG